MWLLAACTRAEVVAAVSTAVVQYQATSAARATSDAPAGEPESGGAPVTEDESGAAPTLAAVATVPVTLLPPATEAPTAADTVSTVNPTPTPVASPTLALTPTPAPSATPIPTATTEPTATPFPKEIAEGSGRLVLVPAGAFEMGQAASDALAECESFRAGCQEEWFAAAEPVHPVYIDDFYIDELEVTNLAYVTFLNEIGDHIAGCGEAPCFDPEQSQIAVNGTTYEVDGELANHPAAGVTWYGASLFCAWRGDRLPTEAEWEKAALWNPETATKTAYPWGDEFDGTRVNFCDASCDAPQANAEVDDGYPAAAPVGSYPEAASPSGALDMAGNVWEWVSDWYSPTAYAESAGADNPAGPETGEARVVRGGSWFDTGNFTAGTIRFPSPANNADKTIGFRCARTP
jgi:serine/threonine-protein kinase